MTDKRLHNATEEFYEEPPRLRGRDTAGVILALVALTIIGFAGYIWLTPGLSFGSLMPEESRASVEQTPAKATAETAALAAGDEQADQHLRCGYCGMYAERSRSHVKAEWTDESITHHCSFDCFFSFGAEKELLLQGVEVGHYDSDPADPDWLDATAAMYLFDTEQRVAGSMPPFVAAGSCKKCTGRLEPELGGAEMNWLQLAAKWPEQAVAIGVLKKEDMVKNSTEPKSH